jgi:hypothetical protein
VRFQPPQSHCPSVLSETCSSADHHLVQLIDQYDHAIVSVSDHNPDGRRYDVVCHTYTSSIRVVSGSSSSLKLSTDSVS